MARYLLGVFGLALIGCGEAEPTPVAEDLLVLELGGGHEQLEVALRRVEAARAPRPQPPAPTIDPAPSTNVEREESQAPRSPQPSPTPETRETIAPQAPEATTELETSPRTVVLQDGQTIYSLAGEHLGAGKRWREILELNGWTEQEATRLRAGQVVKLPPQ